jgi:hypothetical protein
MLTTRTILTLKRILQGIILRCALQKDLHLPALLLLVLLID